MDVCGLGLGVPIAGGFENAKDERDADHQGLDGDAIHLAHLVHLLSSTSRSFGCW